MLSLSPPKCSKSDRVKNIDNITNMISIMTKQYDVKNVASMGLSAYNDKKRERNEDEKMIRSIIGLGSTISSLIIPPVGLTVGTISVASEMIEAYHHIASPIQIEINNNITKNLNKNKSITEETIRDIIFDRCVNQMPM